MEATIIDAENEVLEVKEQIVRKISKEQIERRKDFLLKQKARIESEIAQADELLKKFV